MTYKEILDAIKRNRAVPIFNESQDIQRKFNEIEWALQTLAEKLADQDK